MCVYVCVIIITELNLKVINVNHKIVNFLDVPLNLEIDSHEHYHKPNQTLYYIDYKSNHPKAII